MHRNHLVLLALLSLPAAPLSSATSVPFSWGKPNVTFDQYRKDAVECGRAGYYLDVSGTEAAAVFKDASRQLEANETNLQSANMLLADTNPAARASALSVVTGIVGQSAHIVENTRPAERMKQVGTLMQDKVDDCLRQRGYTRIRLTDVQRARLRHLHLGSAERHSYLYQLSSDPAVLAAQASAE